VDGAGRGFNVDPGVARCVELVQLPAAHPQVQTGSVLTEYASQLPCRGLNDRLRVGGRCVGPEDTRQVSAGDGPAAFAHEVRERECRIGKREAVLPEERTAALDSYTARQVDSQLVGQSSHGSSGEFTARIRTLQRGCADVPSPIWEGANGSQEGDLRLWQDHA
jgi:hypothetical protein